MKAYTQKLLDKAADSIESAEILFKHDKLDVINQAREFLNTAHDYLLSL